MLPLQTVLRVVKPPQAGAIVHHVRAAEIVVFATRTALPTARAPGVHVSGGSDAKPATNEMIANMMDLPKLWYSSFLINGSFSAFKFGLTVDCTLWDAWD